MREFALSSCNNLNHPGACKFTLEGSPKTRAPPQLLGEEALSHLRSQRNNAEDMARVSFLHPIGKQPGPANLQR
jgi:hypothetical protein